MSWPKKPSLLPEVAAELELHCVDFIRAFLESQQPYQGEGTKRDTLNYLGNAVVKRVKSRTG